MACPSGLKCNKKVTFEALKLRWQHVDVSRTSIHRIGWSLDISFSLFWHQTSHVENSF